MKNHYFQSLITIVLISAGTVLMAQSAKQYALFEHFTNTSCGPCAVQNPVFQDNYLQENDGSIHHIAYHPWWPGIDDPFYQFNISENTSRTNYYGVNSVPRMILRGTHWEGQPTGVSWSLINDNEKGGSPVRLVVNESTNGNTRDVTVELESVNSAPVGTYLLRCAVIEKDVEYATPPGNNGETYFPNVFRQFISGASSKLVSLPPKGERVEYSFSYDLDAEWDAEKMYVIALLQEQNSKEVLNSGASYNCGFELMSYETSNTAEVASSSSTSFDGGLINLIEGETEVEVSIESDAPGDWSASFDLDGQTYTSAATTTLNSRAEESLQLNVDVGSTSGIGKYTIKLESSTNPEFYPQEYTYRVISGVQNLVVNNDQPFSNGKLYDWSNIYLDGLAAGEASAYGSIEASSFATLINEGSLQSVNNVYFNVGWTMPPFTSEMVDALQAFLDEGGNLFISGQDIGWAAMDNSSDYNNLKNQTFLKTYLGAEYVKDGNILNNAIFPDENDTVYGGQSTSSLTDVYGSGFFPDEIKVSSEGASKSNVIYYYDAALTKPAAIKSDNGQFKTVYLGFGMEQVASASVQDEIMTTTHEWFMSGITGIEFDREMARLIRTYPNPASEYMHFEIPEHANAQLLIVYDMTGRRVATHTIQSEPMVTVDVSELDNGFYLYEISNQDEVVLKTDKFTISK